MSLFQKVIVKKYLKNLPSDPIDENYRKYSKYFNDLERAERIKALKEEQYQEGFLRELFVECLNYTINPDENFNLTTEFKNKTDAEKADGAILKDNNPVAVIELKSTKTKDLKTIEKQAFNYKAHQSNCKYVITSNFNKIRLYINDATEFEEFNVFQLTKNEFKYLYLCFSKDSIFEDIPAKIKEKSNQHEEQISKKLYNDYSDFRNKIFQNLTKNNSQIDKLILFKKSQKLLDRFLFIFFAEDKGLIPANLISKIIGEFKKLKEMDHYTPLFSEFKRFFGYIDKGNPKYNIDEYNGGLFQFDEVLDNVKIDDEVLIKDSLKLSKYDFDSEVDVNILGHIFEHSLTDIEKLNAELSGENLDKKRTRRKKEGVFYTPNYITKYIVENTIGSLCEEKKKELKLINLEIDETYFRKSKNTHSKKGEQLFDKLENYKEWLLSLKILDPACGSGAFLNQVLNFLIDEHNFIIELKTDLRKGQLSVFEIDTTVLENNLYGVDINEESVEIAQLSLWLKTAKRGRKLTDLSKHIKCGNSLIDDPEIAGDKAFDWFEEFPEIMQNGGFDVVIGNPPYVDIKRLEPEIVKVLFEKYSTAENRINLYSIFIEKGHSILKNKGFFSFINPNSILVNSSYTKIRKLLVDDITTIIKLPDDVFPEAKVETIIFEFRKGGKQEFARTLVYPKDEKISCLDANKLKIQNKKFWKQSESVNYNIYVSDTDISILQKCENGSDLLENFADFSLGITPYDKYRGHSQETIKNRLFHSNTQLDETCKPLISGSNIVRYYVNPQIEEYIRYGEWLGAMREERFFLDPIIIVRQIVSGKPPRIYAGYADQPFYFTQIGFGIIPKPEIQIKYLLVLINSSLLTYYHKYKFLDLEKKLFQKILITNCRQFPIKIISKPKQQPFINKADLMLDLNKQKQEKINKFLHRLETNFEIPKFSKKIKLFYEYDFKTFVKELKKKKVKLSLSQQDEWEEYFENYRKEILELQKQIDKTDKEIDQMVYKLYDLTKEEIEIVEKS